MKPGYYTDILIFLCGAVIGLYVPVLMDLKIVQEITWIPVIVCSAMAILFSWANNSDD